MITVYTYLFIHFFEYENMIASSSVPLPKLGSQQDILLPREISLAINHSLSEGATRNLLIYNDQMVVPSNFRRHNCDMACGARHLSPTLCASQLADMD